MHHTRRSGKTSPLIFDPEIEKTARRNRASHQFRSRPAMSHHSDPNNQPPPNQPPPNQPNPNLPPQQPPLGDMPPPPFQPPPQRQQPPPFPQQFHSFDPDPNASSSRPGQQRHQDFNEWDEHYDDYTDVDIPPQQQHQPLPLNQRSPPTRTSRSNNTAAAGSTYVNESRHGTAGTFNGRVAEWDAGFDDDGYYVNQDQPNFDNEGYREFVPPYQNRQGNQRGFNQRGHNQGQRRDPQNQQQNPLRGNVQRQYVDGVPRVNYRPPARGVGSYFIPVATEHTSHVVPPHQNGRSFEVRPQYLSHLPTFYGKATEEPYLHIAEFVSICNTIGGHGFTQEEVKLMMFQFTLKDQARIWYHSLPAGSIYTWQELQQQFLEEYYTMTRTSEAREAIRTFQQHSGEPFHEAFTRFKELLRKCPHHDIPMWELIKSFYDGLLPEDVRDLNANSNGTFLTNTEEVDWEYMERLAVTSKRQARASRRSRSGATRGVDVEAEKRIASLERQIAQLTAGRGPAEVMEQKRRVLSQFVLFVMTWDMQMLIVLLSKVKLKK